VQKRPIILRSLLIVATSEHRDRHDGADILTDIFYILLQHTTATHYCNTPTPTTHWLQHTWLQHITASNTLLQHIHYYNILTATRLTATHYCRQHTTATHYCYNTLTATHLTATHYCRQFERASTPLQHTNATHPLLQHTDCNTPTTTTHSLQHVTAGSLR